MKKIIYLSLILLLLGGCNKKLDNKKEIINNEPIKEIVEEIKEPVYVDNNPIKIAFYKKQNDKYIRLDKYSSTYGEFKEIGIFLIILSNEEEVVGSSIKSLYKSISENIPNFSNYKTGFNLKFTLNDGTIINENFFKPQVYNSYAFGEYLYVWIYDDVNTTGWHSHIEENEFNDSTIMSSVKLMWAPGANLINSNIEFTVFTYDEDEFDEYGHYIGNSKYTTIIERN